MVIESGVKNWLGRLRSNAQKGINPKVCRHAKDTLYSAQKLDENTMIRKH